jgi:hypothetical protein
MRRVFKASENLIAILGLISVLIAALEHEDLLFQDDREWNASAATTTALDSRPPLEWRTSHLGDTGTEGTFRLRAQPLWLLPLLAVTALLRLVRPAITRPAWWWRIGGPRQVRPFAAGGLVLRP